MQVKLLSAVAVAALLIGCPVSQAANKGGGAGQSQNAPAMQHQGGDMGSDAGACPPNQDCTGNGAMQNDQTQGGGQMQQNQSGQADQQPVKRRQNQAAGANGQNGAADQDQAQTQQNNANEPATTGSIRAPAKITGEQRTKIKASFHHEHVRPVAHIDFDINVGVAIPTTIVLNPLPADVVAIVPAYEGYEYFVAPNGVIVIVDPGTLQIVYVLTA